MQESRKFECSDRLTRTHQTQSSHFCLYQTSLSSFSRSANQRRRNPHWPTQCLIPSRKAAHFLLCLQLWKAGIGRDRRCCCGQSVQEWVEAVRRAGAGRDWFEVGEQTRDFGEVESQGCRSLSCCYARCYMGCCYCCKRSDHHQVGADFAMLGIFVGRTVGLGVEVWFDMATADQIGWILNLLLADLRVGLFVAVMIEAGRGRRLILLAVVMRGSELPRRDFMSGKFWTWFSRNKPLPAPVLRACSRRASVSVPLRKKIPLRGRFEKKTYAGRASGLVPLLYAILRLLVDSLGETRCIVGVGKDRERRSTRWRYMSTRLSFLSWTACGGCVRN